MNDVTMIERHAWNGEGGVRKMLLPTVKMPEGDSRVIRFTVSTAARDRDGDIVEPSGWDLSHYRNNPIVLWAHDSGRPPIGKATSIEVNGGELVADAEFATRETSPFADEIFKLYEGGFLSAVSAGFMPTAKEPILDGDGMFTGFRFMSQVLWEFSAVPIPSNPEALRKAKDGGLSVKGCIDWIEQKLDEGAEHDRDFYSTVYTNTVGKVHPVIQGQIGQKNFGDKTVQTKGDPRTLYMKRDVLNGDDIAAWAKDNGFSSTLPADDMHVTLAFSRSPVDWEGITAKSDDVTIDNGPREMKALGENGEAIVLRITDAGLSDRWKQLCDAGCSWDHDGYQPHVTLSYQGAPDNWTEIPPYDGPIKLGPEVMQEAKEDWKDNIDERSAPKIFVCSFDLDGERCSLYAAGADFDDVAASFKGHFEGFTVDGELIEVRSSRYSEKGRVEIYRQKGNTPDEKRIALRELDTTNRAAMGTVITTTGGDGHEHTFNLGDDTTAEAGDPAHVHAVVYDETGQAIVRDAEDHGHDVAAGATLDLDESGVAADLANDDEEDPEKLAETVSALQRQVEQLATKIQGTAKPVEQKTTPNLNEVMEHLAPSISSMVVNATKAAIQQHTGRLP
ncbi:MAG: hypothetical protein AAF479_08310 [Pseudomonadota bacterium]